MTLLVNTCITATALPSEGKLDGINLGFTTKDLGFIGKNVDFACKNDQVSENWELTTRLGNVEN